jgi:F-type H+-transporting ATPase subunit a
VVLALDFPPISHLIEWPDFWLKGNKYFAVNKVVLLMFLAFVLVAAFYFAAARRKSLVPTGVQNAAEAVVDFVHEGIILQTMGPEGLPWAPFLLTVFSFVFVCNVFEIIPGIQMPVTARIALPAFLAVLYFFLFIIVGFMKQGPIGFFKHIMFPPGVPVFMYIILTPINFISDLIVRPFALAVRLFANLLAGHLILVSFVVLSTALFDSTIIGAVAPGALLIALTGFELLVSFLQAYIITILIAVFISGAMHVEHEEAGAH